MTVFLNQIDDRLQNFTVFRPIRFNTQDQKEISISRGSFSFRFKQEFKNVPGNGTGFVRWNYNVNYPLPFEVDPPSGCRRNSFTLEVNHDDLSFHEGMDKTGVGVGPFLVKGVTEDILFFGQNR